MRDAPYRVLIVDDHELLAHILERSLREEGMETAVATGERLGEAVAIARDFRPDVCLLDLDLGLVGDGRDLIEPLRSGGSAVILLTGSRDRAAIGEGLASGAVGVLTKDEPFETLARAIEEAARGEAEVMASTRHACLNAMREQRIRDRRRLAPFERLTPREQEVLVELTRGSTAATIAERSYVSLSTVRSQIRSVLTKLGVTSQLAAVAMANEAGWG